MKKIKCFTLLFLIVCIILGINACKTEVHVHTYSNKWTSDVKGHWHIATCEHTNEISNFAEHSYGNYVSNNDATIEADGTKTRTCKVCGYKDTKTDEGSKIHVHIYSNEWRSDVSGHWHIAICEHINEISDFTEHSYSEYVSNEDATTEADGTKTRICSICYFQDTITDEGSKIHVHTYSNELKKDENGHWYECCCGEKTEFMEHTYGVYVSNGDATPESDGTKTRSCNVCSYKDTVTDYGTRIKVPDRFVFVKAGSFRMGCEVGPSNNQPVHNVIITKPFYMGKYEITQMEYKTYCDYEGKTPSSTYGKGNEYPAYYVSWYDVLVYCNKRSIAEGLTPCYIINGSTDTSTWGSVPTSSDNTWNSVVCNWDANGYRLPTEAEWEYVARAGDNSVSTTISGNGGKLSDYAWYHGNSSFKKSPVGTKESNKYGFFDLIGNVREWCWNWETDEYNIITEGLYNPIGASSGVKRINRGGDTLTNADACNVSHRFYGYPYERTRDVGFRVVRAFSE